MKLYTALAEEPFFTLFSPVLWKNHIHWCCHCCSSSSPKTELLVNSHTFIGTAAFVLTSTDLLPLPIRAIKGLTASPHHLMHPKEQNKMSREQCRVPRTARVLPGLVVKHKTSLTHWLAIGQNTFPALILYTGDKIVPACSFLLTVVFKQPIKTSKSLELPKSDVFWCRHCTTELGDLGMPHSTVPHGNIVLYWTQVALPKFRV